MRVLVTGGCGFLGSNFVKRLISGGDEVVVLDRLADFETLARLEGVPHEFVQGDVADAVTATGAADGCAAIVNFAAETNLDESGLASGGFIVTDVFGTHVLLEFARVARIPFVQVSTADASAASSPAAASRAAADLQVRAYVETHGLRGSIVRGVSVYGPFQHPAAEPAASIVQALGEEGAALAPPRAPGSMRTTIAPPSSGSCGMARPVRSIPSVRTTRPCMSWAGPPSGASARDSQRLSSGTGRTRSGGSPSTRAGRASQTSTRGGAPRRPAGPGPRSICDREPWSASRAAGHEWSVVQSLRARNRPQTALFHAFLT
jgi:NAD(P)-dependent dehydrogenase (short-subunit alcohol dehydrogenase family)